MIIRSISATKNRFIPRKYTCPHKIVQEGDKIIIHDEIKRFSGIKNFLHNLRVRFNDFLHPDSLIAHGNKMQDVYVPYGKKLIRYHDIPNSCKDYYFSKPEDYNIIRYKDIKIFRGHLEETVANFGDDNSWMKKIRNFLGISDVVIP